MVANAVAVRERVVVFNPQMYRLVADYLARYDLAPGVARDEELRWKRPPGCPPVEVVRRVTRPRPRRIDWDGDLARALREILQADKTAFGDWLGVTRNAVQHWEGLGRERRMRPSTRAALDKLLHGSQPTVQRQFAGYVASRES